MDTSSGNMNSTIPLIYEQRRLFYDAEYANAPDGRQETAALVTEERDYRAGNAPQESGEERIGYEKEKILEEIAREEGIVRQSQEVLETDLTYREIADYFGWSSTATRRRVKDWERTGVVTCFRTATRTGTQVYVRWNKKISP